MITDFFRNIRQRWQSWMNRANHRLEFWLTNPKNIERNHRMRVLRNDEDDAPDLFI